jgi:hypothetical protein
MMDNLISLESSICFNILIATNISELTILII